MAEPRPETSLRTRAARSTGEGAAFSPLYRQIKDLLVQSLERGEWKPGELIPSEIDLAARFQVSQGTVRKAVGGGDDDSDESDEEEQQERPRKRRAPARSGAPRRRRSEA